MPTSISDDEKRVRCYLLRLASEGELDQIEETFLATSDHSELINDVERRLISDYVEQRLSEQEKVAFERNYLVTNERREQLAIAQALGEMEHAVPREARGQRVLGYERRNVLHRFLDWMGAPGPIVGFAAAAITVVLFSANVGLFLKWREQAHQTAMVTEQVRTLQALKEHTRPTITTVRIVGIPVLKVEETSLSAGEQQKLTFRLPPEAPDSIEIPLELPTTASGATVDVTLSSSGRSIWSESAIHLRSADKILRADLLIPFSALRPHLGTPLMLEVVDRGHADLGTFQLIFELEK